MAIKKFNSVEGFSVGEPGNVIDVIDNIGNVTTGNLVVTSFSDLGNVANIRITGGSSGYTLRTDGAGNLTWGIDSAAAGGLNTQVQYNSSNIFAGSANFTFDDTTNTLSVTNISANGALLTNITGSNVTGQVGNSLLAGTVYINAQPNITSVGTLISLDVTGNITSGNADLGNLVTGNYFSGNGYLLTGLTGANVTGQVANSLIAGTVYTNAQPNITSVGTLTTLNVSGNITSGNASLGNLASASYFVGNGYQITGLTLSNSLTDVQITSANNGQLLGYNGVNWVNVDNNPTVGAGPGTGFWFTGPVIIGTSANNSIQLDTLSSSPNTSAQIYANATINGTGVVTILRTGSLNRTVFDAGNWDFSIWANISSTGGTSSIGASIFETLPYTIGTITITGTGTTRTATASAGTPFANVTPGSSVTSSSYLETTLGIYRITSKTSSTVVSIDVPSTYVNESAVTGYVYNPLWTVGTSLITSTSFTEYLLGTSEALYTLEGGTNSGLGILIYGTTSASKSIYVALNGQQTASHVSTPLHTLHDDLAGLQGGQSNQYYHLTQSEYTGTGTGVFVRQTSPQLTSPNIDSATGATLTLTGNITSGNASLGNLVTGNYFSGNGSLLTSITGSTVVGNVTSAIQSHYANIANSISGSNVVGNVTSAVQSHYANIANLVAGGNVTGQVANALIAGTVYTNVQPNITSVGTLNGLTGTGTIDFTGASNVSLGSVSNLHITGGTSGYILRTDGSGTLTWVNPSGAGVSGANKQVQFNDTGSFGSNSNFTYDKATSTLNVTGNITRDSKNVPTFVSSTTTPSNPKLGDEWYDTVNDIIYQYIYDGSNYNWIDVSSSYILANASAVPNTIALRDGNANLVANYFIGDGSQLTGIGSAGNIANGTSNVNIPVINGNVNTSVGGTSNVLVVSTTGVYVTGTINTTSNVTSGNASLGNLVTANYFSGNGSLLTSLTGSNVVGNVTSAVQAHYANIANSVSGSNVTGQVSNALIAGTVYIGAQPNITSVGILQSTTFAANSNITLSGSLSQIIGANTISGTYLTGTLTTQTQPNITSVGTLTNLNISGNVTSGNASLGNLVVANYFSGDGSLLTNLSIANASVANANYATYAGTVLTNAQPNITSVGSLSTLVVSGDTTITGNLIVSGTVEYTNVTSLKIQDPLIEQGGNANGNPLTSNDGKDRGSLLHYYTTSAVDAFMGWKNSAGEFVFASNVSTTNDVVTVNTYGNIHVGNANLGNLASASYFSGNGSLLTSLTGTNVVGNVTSAIQSHYANIANSVAGANVSGNVTSAIQSHYANIANSVSGSNVSGQVGNALIAGTVYIGAQPNITSVGTLSSLNVTANISSGSYLLGNGAFITGLPAGYSNAQVAAYLPTYTGLIGGTLSTGAQPNVTSLGTLTSLTVTGNVTSGNASLGNLVTASYFSGDGSLLSSLTGSNVVGNVTSAVQSHYANIANSVTGGNVSGQVSNALIAGTVYTNAQPNITSVGNLSGLTVSNSSGIVNFSNTANVTLGSISNLHIAGGSPGYTLRTDGAGNLSWAVDSAAAGGNTTEVQFNDGGSLAGDSKLIFNKTTGALTLTGNVTTNNANLGNLVVANYFSGNGSLLSSITGSNVVGNVDSAVQSHYANIANSVSGTNVSGQVGNALIAGTVYTNAQPNITSVGSLSGLTVSNSAGIINFSNTANVTLGSISNLHISGGSAGYTLRTDGAGNLSWAVDSAAAGGNTTEIQFNDSGSLSGDSKLAFNKTTGALTLTGNVTTNNASLGNLASANYFTGNGSLLTSLTGGNVTGQVSNSLIAGTVYTGAQPNITSVGTLTTLNVTGNVSSGANLLGKLYSSTNTTLAVPGPGNVSGERVRLYDFGSPSATNFAIGVEDHYIWNAVDATSAGFKWYAGNTMVANLFGTGAFSVTGNISSGSYLLGNGAFITGLPAGYSNTQVAAYLPTYTGLIGGTLSTASQPNITSTGTLTSLSVTGNVSSSGNLIGNGQYLTSLTGSNVVGNVDSAIQSHYANIANSVAGGDVTGQVANALIAGTVYTNAQPNITSVGTLSDLTVNGLSNLGSVSNITITGGSAGYVLTTNGLGAVSWQTVSGGGGTTGFVNIIKDRFTGNNVANTFNLSTVPGSLNLIEVNIDGLLQVSNTYSLSGSTVSFPTAPASGQIIEVTTYGTANVTGGDGAIQFSTSSNLLASSTYLNFDTVTNTLTSNYFSGNGYLLTGLTGANVTGQVANALIAGTVYTNSQPNITSVGTLSSLSVTGNISANNVTTSNNMIISGGYLTIGSGLIAISSGNAGVFTSGIANINIGLAGNVTLGSTTGTVTARGTLISPNISSTGNLVVSDTATITNLKVNDFYSNRTPVSVTTNTVVDSFPINKYRSAKYTMRVNSDDGYQAVEALLIHDGVQSYVTIYGSLSTIGYDIITLTTDINSGTVRMLATTVSTNTTVNMLGTYVAD